MAVPEDTRAADSSTPSDDHGGSRMLTPPPQPASTELAAHVGEIASDSSMPKSKSRRGSRHSLPQAPASTPSAKSSAVPVSGLPQSPVSHKGASLPQSPEKIGTEQQQRQTLAPLVTVSAPPSHGPLPSPRTYSHVVRVRGVPLDHMPRRDSVSSIRSILSSHAIGKRDSKCDKSGDPDEDIKELARNESKEAGSLTPPPEAQLHVSAYIIPRPDDKTRKMIHLERDFDLQTLLDSVPRPPPQSAVDRKYRSSVSILASPIVGISPLSLSSPRTPVSGRPAAASLNERKPLPGSASPLSVTSEPSTTGTKRPAVDISPNTPASPHPSLRRQAAKHSRQPSEPSPRELPSPDQILVDGSVLIPLCPHPSLGGLPALAAIILSKRVEAGDLVELPLPHPAEWPRTIAFVYHGRGELTSHVRQNMEYLGGKCE
ncbi:hypothetical protein SEPCBS119000_002924 [Sporothrix epigloea]|uniref:Uncharacterized protein n=1 Tax=Sporothrix epigloea TaxID=1892477 RepID=A0ABP0DKL1_9PEZI